MPAAAILVLSAVTPPAGVAAHNGGAVGIALSAERLPPGGPLELIGIDFASGEQLEVVLSGPSGSTSLGPVTAGPDGHFQVVLALPTSMTAGVYVVDVISTSGITQRETFEVDPGAVAPELTPTPADVRANSVGPDLGGPAWEVAPLAATALVGILFIGFVLRRSRVRGATTRP